MTTFDFIIVGAGSAGCVLANRLTESGKYSALLLEAGPADRNIWIHFTLGIGKTIADPSINWMLQSEPEDHACGRRLAVPRGRVLGGSSSINGGVYVRGSRHDYDHWAQLGCRGWSHDDVLPYFKRSETFERGESELRGGSGPLRVSDVRERDRLLDGVLAAAQSLGYPINPDVNGAQQDGFSYSQTTTRDGWRNSTAQAYLKPARRRPNLTVMTGARVSRILFEGRRAAGLEYTRAGRTWRCTARREIVLSAGAVHSPAILELSGIGDARRLGERGVAVIADLPAVGENLQDHWAVWMKWRIGHHLTLNERTRGWRALVEAVKFAFMRRGALTMPAGPIMGFVRTRPGLGGPDVQYHATPLSFENPELRRLDRFPGLTISTLVLRPESRGSVHIRSPRPDVAPEIRFNAFSADYDVETIVAGMKIARDIAAAPALSAFEPVERTPGSAAVTDRDLAEHVRAFGNSCFHLSGTCRMGTGSDAVVDPRLRVRGIEGLRVADASIMPTIVSGNTNAPTIMIGEKASDLILADIRS